MKKKSPPYNLLYAGLCFLLISILGMSGCASFETTSATPVNTEVAGLIEMTPETVIEPLDSPTSVRSVSSPSPISITITPQASVIAATLPATSVATPTNLAVTPNTVTLCETGLKSVPGSDPRWSAITERVDELEGFYALALSPDGNFLAAVEREPDLLTRSHIYLWEVSTGDMQWLVESEEAISAAGISFSSDGSLLATGASDVDPNVFVWDAATGNLLHKFSYPGRTISLSFSPDNKYLAVGGLYPATAAVWNLEDESVTELNNGNGARFVPNSEEPILIVYKAWRRQNEPSPIYIFDLLNGQQKYLFPGAFGADGVALSLDGQIISAVTFEDEKGTLRIFDLHEELEIQVENSQLGFVQVRQAAFSSVDHLAVLQGELNIWSADGHYLACLDEDTVDGFIFTPDGSYLLTYGIIEAPLKIWELPPP